MSSKELSLCLVSAEAECILLEHTSFALLPRVCSHLFIFILRLRCRTFFAPRASHLCSRCRTFSYLYLNSFVSTHSPQPIKSRRGPSPGCRRSRSAWARTTRRRRTATPGSRAPKTRAGAIRLRLATAARSSSLATGATSLPLRRPLTCSITANLIHHPPPRLLLPQLLQRLLLLLHPVPVAAAEKESWGSPRRRCL